ncbi:uncharacterized protein FPRO_05491 [Fusarium proliferatum ET1]|uniref:Protein kinase domain-containing protein n=1 Tax=Fusarium proliferatum (strain ET1) TaxID=1227346 RepID=A0A1L7VJ35_FUSPR|nr:uncharacterized protein FPRO_05491 [Fusarium proliferatum ET1]CZR40591.1 uncharacterized protein FPRO_05491 [Fusarium proliferatum ET1]
MTEKLDVARELAKSVSYGHTFGFVHKDVRPETVLTLEEAKTSSRSTFLVGFGLIFDGIHIKYPARVKDKFIEMAHIQLPAYMVSRYAQVVHTCLTCLDPDNIDFGPEAEFPDEDGIRFGVGFCSG